MTHLKNALSVGPQKLDPLGLGTLTLVSGRPEYFAVPRRERVLYGLVWLAMWSDRSTLYP